jgi:hypothetical protein
MRREEDLHPSIGPNGRILYMQELLHPHLELCSRFDFLENF